MESASTQCSSPRLPERICANKALHSGLVAAVVLLCIGQTLSLQFPGLIRHENSLNDFHAFYITGKLVLAGHAASAYNWQIVRAEQLHVFGAVSFMPWAYSPQFTAFSALFALFPIGASYFLFTVLTFLFFDRALRKLSGAYFPAAMAFAYPAIVINARLGQTGFLTAALIGNFLLYYRMRDWRAGWFLGSMLVKPHLAGGITILAFLGKRWTAILAAAGLTLGTAAAVTVLLGWDIWDAYLRGSRAATLFLWHGVYPLERMTSLYASLYRFGFHPIIALSVHTVVAVMAVIAIALAFIRGLQENQFLALVVISSALISPYNYDYDQVMLSLAAGLVLPDILKRAAGWEILVMGLLFWISTMNALTGAFFFKFATSSSAAGPISSSPFILIILIGFALCVLRRPGTDRSC